MQIIFPDTPLLFENDLPSVFLAGSIDMGKAIDWQQSLCNELSKAQWNGYVLNPRRPDWDNSWEQHIDNIPFRKQVEWELEGLEKASLIVFYFAPESKAPITLLELGLHAKSGKCVVCCPEGFWRKGNIDIVCQKYQVLQVEDMQGLLGAILQQTTQA